MSSRTPVSATILVVGEASKRAPLEAAVAHETRRVIGIEGVGDAVELVAEGTIDVVLLDLASLRERIPLSVIGAALMGTPGTGVVVIVHPDQPELVQRVRAQGAAFALLQPDDAVIGQVIELVLRSQANIPPDRVRLAVEAIGEANNAPRIRARALKWASALTNADGAALYKHSDQGMHNLLSISREHPEQLRAIAPRALVDGPMALQGTEEERVQLKLPVDSIHGPALFVPIPTRLQPASLLTAVREEGAAPFTAGQLDMLATIAAATAVAFDRLSSEGVIETRADEIERLKSRLRDAERSQGIGEIATGYAHQIQNPLQYLQAHLREAVDAAEDLAEGCETLDDALECIRDGVDRVQAIVGELSLLGRSRTDAQVPAARLIGIAQRITKMRPGIEVRVEVDPVSVVGHLTNLVHALHKLLDNAVLAAHEQVTITVKRGEGDTAEIVIANDGGGMPRNVATRIFEPFFTTRKGATDTGLPDARDIITSSGGTLAIETRLGWGTKAIVTLPLAAATADLMSLPDN